MGAYSRWALIRGWALIRINTVFHTSSPLRNIELSVKTLNVMAKARRSAKIRMGNGKPFHLDFTI